MFNLYFMLPAFVVLLSTGCVAHCIGGNIARLFYNVQYIACSAIFSTIINKQSLSTTVLFKSFAKPLLYNCTIKVAKFF